mmetsp:Transcript_6448/g.8468  ORF Transcript_6448/g.8468 Transcript_6448/m.8468 type:complete len:136 (+) Transcript_6448:85-492(+)
MTYYEMIKAAILALKDRTGSSPQAIKSHILTNFPGVKFQQHSLRLALKKGVEAGKLVKVKASFKLSAEEKKPPKKKVVKKKPAKKAKAKKPAKKTAKKKKKPAKKTTKKKRSKKPAKKAPKNKLLGTLESLTRCL